MSENRGRATWVIDPTHTVVEFAIKHMMFATVKGRFGKVEGQIEADLDDLTTANVNVTVDVASIDTREEQRDAHLRSADFFDVEKYPTMTFQSRQITRRSDGQYDVQGDLTIRGVTRPVTLTATVTGSGKDPWGNYRAGFSAQGQLNRKDFGLTWNAALEAGGFLVGDEVKINLEVEAVRQD